MSDDIIWRAPRVHIPRKIRRILTAIHQAEQPPHALALTRDTGYGPVTVYPALERLLLAGWIGGKPHPTRPAWTVYHLTYRGQLRAGLDQTKEQ